MLELSLHILDIANNSVKAKASLIEISVEENVEKNFLRIVIKDNGCGMDEDFLSQVTDPFKTTRTTRKVGMGLSLFKAAAENTGGSLEIKSEKGVGTEVSVNFVYDHIDRQPLGDIAETLTTLISGNSAVDFVYRHIVNEKEFTLDTRKIREVLGGDISLGSPEIVIWMKDYVKEGLGEISI